MIGTRAQAASRHSGIDQRFNLRHPETGGDAGGASAAGADAHFHRVHTPFHEESHAFGRGDVARDQLKIAEACPERLDGPRHHDAVAVRDVNDNDVDARPDELVCSLEIVAFGPDRRADTQAAELVAGRKRQALLPHDVLGGNEAEQDPASIDERELLDLALDHQPLGRIERQLAFADHERLTRCHPRGDRLARSADETDIARGQHSFEPAPLVHHHQRADAALAHEGHRLGQRGGRRHRIRIADDDVLGPLHFLDFADLR